MADRRFRQDVGDYLSDEEYAAYLASKAKYAKENTTPGMKEYAESLRGSGPGPDPMDKMQEDIDANPLIAPPVSEFQRGMRNAQGLAEGGTVRPSNVLEIPAEIPQMPGVPPETGMYNGGKVKEDVLKKMRGY